MKRSELTLKPKNTLKESTADSICSLSSLGELTELTEAEKNWKETADSLPVKVTKYYFSLIDKSDFNDPLRLQVFPSVYENHVSTGEDPDPLSEVSHSHSERLIHRYSNRVAFLTTDYCAQYCRHCFRRRFTGNMYGPASDKDIDFACNYLSEHTEICEMLLTGGDVLTLDNRKIEKMVSRFREVSPHLIIRICTRIPVVEPSRIDDELVRLFVKHDTAPFFLMVQYNHPRELTRISVNSVKKFINAGIPAFNQTVLLHRVNDDADVLEKLFNALLYNRIKPYYVFQGDLVSGTSHFRVQISRTLEIEKELRKRLSGLAMPAFVLDLPQGGGKVPLCGSYIVSDDSGKWTFNNLNGERRIYYDSDVIL